MKRWILILPQLHYAFWIEVYRQSVYRCGKSLIEEGEDEDEDEDEGVRNVV